MGIKKPLNPAGVAFSLVGLAFFIATLIHFRRQLSDSVKFGIPIWLVGVGGIVISLGLLWGGWFRKRGDF